MWRLLVAMKRGLGIRHCKKISRVADESRLGQLALDQGQDNRSANKFSVMLAIVRAPMVVASCFVGQSNAMEEVWMSGERPRRSEMDHLMVRDSMRYAMYA